MRYIVILFLLFLLTIALCRPADNEERGSDKYDDVEESDYDGGEQDIVNDNSQQQDEGNIDDKAANMMQRSSYERSPNSKSQADDKDNLKFSENKPIQLIDTELNNRLQNTMKERLNNEYNDNNDNDFPESAQHFPNREVNSQKSKRIRNNCSIDKKNNDQNDKGLVQEEGSFLFENSDRDQKEKLNYNEDEDLSEEVHYPRYYSSMNSQNNNSTLYRNRRQASETPDSSITKDSNIERKSKDVSTNTDEEAAIKRHIDKLTNDELEQLLNTLTNEKRSLLTKIIMDNNSMDRVETPNNNDATNDLKKREITKKASVIDENSFIENNQLEALKLERDLNTELVPMIQSHDANSSRCFTDQILNVTPEISSMTDEFKQSSLLTSFADTFNDSTVRTDLSKTANKREIQSYDPNGAEETDFSNFNKPSGGEETFGLQAEEQFVDSINDDTENFDSGNTCKRDTFFEENSDIADSIKSLQESFPNSDSDDGSDPYLESNMAPLVRVKRGNTDLLIKKRAAAVLPEAKVAYLPYKPENDDEDNDEANEFDDDGFYVRTSNLAIDTDKDKAESDSGENDSQLSKTEDAAPPTLYKESENGDVQSDSSNIGSDTDSVLSGSEGVDDNLMLSNCARNKRSESVNTISAEYELNRENVELEQNGDHALMDEKSSKVSGNNMNFPNYQENDAFGIPRNCEGEVNRYKRIRRVKHLPAAIENITKPNL